MLSRQDNKPPLSFTLTRDAILKLNPNTEIVILAKKIEGNVINKLKYCFHVLSQMYHIATSKIVIVDGYCIPVSTLNHKKEQKFIQMWHALNVIKKFAYLALDKPAGVKKELAEIMCMHKNYTHIISGSLKTGKLLAKSFNTSEDSIVVLGLPYLDYILSKDQTRIQEIEHRYPQIKNKKNILYAPTFRKHHQVNIEWIKDTINLDEYNVIVKLHPVDQKGVKEQNHPSIIYDTEYMSYEWLWKCETVITDYSGISVESALLNRKLYFYAYDLERYEQETGLNINLYDEPIHHYVCETSKQLRELLQEDYNYDVLQAYKEKYIEFKPGTCSEEFAKWLLKELN